VSIDILKLHNEGYSKISGYYNGIAKDMTAIRQEVLATVLDAKNLIPNQVIGHPNLSSLPKSSTILDVGCATGDNLSLMRDQGYTDLTGIDIAEGMIEEARQKLEANFYCNDLFSFSSSKKFDLVFAQAFVHLFPKTMLPEVFSRLLALSNRRVYFSTTIHEEGCEGLEPKQEIIRYRSRYTLPEILQVVRNILADDPCLSFHYFFLTDPLGKFWINGVFERHDIQKIMEEDGVFLYRQFASPEQVRRVLPEIDNFRLNQPPPGTILRYDTETVFDRVENIVPYCSDALREVLHSQRILNIVSLLLQEEAVLLKDKINFKMPGCGQFVPHQDAAAGWDRYGDSQLTYALCFDEATEENGALYFSRGTHKRGLLSPLKTPLSDELVKSLQWEMIPMSPGDALFFNALAPHYSEANRTRKSRRMAFMTYHAKKFGDHRESFFADKRKRQPPIDERPSGAKLFRDKFGKLVYLLLLFFSFSVEASPIAEQIKNSLVPYENFPKEGIVFRDISPILENPKLFTAIIDAFYDRYKEIPIDAIVAPESRGFLFGAALAYKLNVPLVMLRKEGKLPGEVFRATFKKLYGEDTFVMHKSSLKPGQQVIIIDDFYSTGGSLKAASELVEAAGAKVYEGAFLINNTEVATKLSFPFPIFALYELR
jgi:adenine phosphoribosyltransferase